MANRSYPQFGKVKTIVLPIPSSPLTYQQYKEAYGIDLKDFLIVNSNGNLLLEKLPNTLLMFDVTSIRLLGYPGIPNLVSVGALPTERIQYAEGQTDGELRYYFSTYDNDSGKFVPVAYVYIRLDKDSERLIENFVIGEEEF